MNIKTAPVPTCPICGGNGFVAIANARDYITKLTGDWTFRECCRCHSLWQDPCPLKEEIGKLYPKNYHFTHSAPEVWINRTQGLAGSAKLAILEKRYGYEGLSARAGSRLGKFLGKLAEVVGLSRRRAGQTVRFLHAQRGGRLLDVGCGSGGFLSLMKELGWECEGVEPDPGAAKVAVSLGHNVRHGSIEDLDLPEAHYDAVTLSHVMEHFPDPKVAMAAIARVLKPGGILVSTSPNPTGIIRRWFRENWYGLDPARHLVLPSARGYALLSENFGLRSVQWTSAHQTFWYVRESVSIKRTGAPGNCHAKVWPKFLAVGLALARPLFRNIGEEVVCYAVKK